MKLTYHDFYALFGAATAEECKDRYIAEWGTSSIFYPTPESPDINPDELADVLGNIWDVAHLTPRNIREHMGLTQVKFAERFCIPITTVKNWDAYHRKTPPYLILLLAKEAGMLHVKFDA